MVAANSRSTSASVSSVGTVVALTIKPPWVCAHFYTTEPTWSRRLSAARELTSDGINSALRLGQCAPELAHGGDAPPVRPQRLHRRHRHDPRAAFAT